MRAKISYATVIILWFRFDPPITKVEYFYTPYNLLPLILAVNFDVSECKAISFFYTKKQATSHFTLIEANCSDILY